MGGLTYGADMRDTERQGTKYNGSGCLVHGLSVLADAFTAIDCYLQDHPNDEMHLVDALKNNFAGYGELHKYLLACPKFGNHEQVVDREAGEIMRLHETYVNFLDLSPAIQNDIITRLDPASTRM